MNERRKKQLSKRLSYVLRHDPSSVAVELDEAGWTDVEALLSALAASGAEMTRDELGEVVATSAKKRFALSADGQRIRANQGHSIAVELGYEPSQPPAVLFHGTHPGALESIRESGLEPRGRHHVHLSADIETASAVGARRGRPVILEVAAAAMSEAGFVFYLSANGVWLVDQVPPSYLKELPRRRN